MEGRERGRRERERSRERAGDDDAGEVREGAGVVI